MSQVIVTGDGAGSLTEPTHHVVLQGIDWSTYIHLRQTLDDSGRHVKLYYDDGSLLIEMPNKFHEVVKMFVGGLLNAYLFDHRIDFAPLGATTWRREIKKKGLEADDCYYIQHADIADLHEEADLDLDPPPDLAIEVEVTRPLMAKLPVYAGIGIPELWHLRGWHDVRILALDPRSETYSEVSASLAIPEITPGRLRGWIDLRRQLSYPRAIEACRKQWL